MPSDSDSTDDEFFLDAGDAAMALDAEEPDTEELAAHAAAAGGRAAAAAKAAASAAAGAAPSAKPAKRAAGSWQWWERNDRPHCSRFVEPFKCPLPECLLAAAGVPAEQGGSAVRRPWELELAQCDGGSGPDSDAQVTIWDAAVVLHRIMLRDGLECFADKVVVEIGAGSGLVGMTAALLGAKVLITDLAEVLPTLTANITANSAALARSIGAGPASCAAAELAWGTALPADVVQHCSGGLGGKADFVVATDVVYAVQFLPQLASTLADLCGPDSRVVLVNERRWSDVDGWFEDELTKFFHFSEMPLPDATFAASAAGGGGGCGGGEPPSLSPDEVLSSERAPRFWVLELRLRC